MTRINPRRSWRHQLIAARIRELEDAEHDIERTLARHANKHNIRDAVLHLRELDALAGNMWVAGELDYADTVCERFERALIELRGIAREVIGAA